MNHLPTTLIFQGQNRLVFRENSSYGSLFQAHPPTSCLGFSPTHLKQDMRLRKSNWIISPKRRTGWTYKKIFETNTRVIWGSYRICKGWYLLSLLSFLSYRKNLGKIHFDPLRHWTMVAFTKGSWITPVGCNKWYLEDHTRMDTWFITMLSKSSK